MRRSIAVAALLVVVLGGYAARAQEESRPVPLSDFVKVFTDLRATAAQKEVGLPEGTWYEGTITVSDVEYYKAQGKDPAWAEVKDWNYVGGCTMLLFRTQDTESALKLRVGDQAVVRAKLANIGVHLSKFATNCGTHVGVFTDTRILTIHKPTN